MHPKHTRQCSNITCCFVSTHLARAFSFHQSVCSFHRYCTPPWVSGCAGLGVTVGNRVEHTTAALMELTLSFLLVLLLGLCCLSVFHWSNERSLFPISIYRIVRTHLKYSVSKAQWMVLVLWEWLHSVKAKTKPSKYYLQAYTRDYVMRRVSSYLVTFLPIGENFGRAFS